MYCCIYKVDEKIQDKTALHLACARGNLELAKVLLEHNANVNVQVRCMHTV